MQRITLILILALLIAVPQAYAEKLYGVPLYAGCAMLTAGNYCPMYFAVKNNQDEVIHCRFTEHSSISLRFKLFIWIMADKEENDNKEIDIEGSWIVDSDDERIFEATSVTIHGKKFGN